MKSRVSLKYFVSYCSSLTNKKNIKTQLYMTLLKSEIPALPSNIEPHYPKFFASSGNTFDVGQYTSLMSS